MAALEIEIAELKAKLETERLRLAACGVAAMANTRATAEQRLTKDNPYWSASYGDVCAAVDREMSYRDEVAAMIIDCVAMGREIAEWEHTAEVLMIEKMESEKEIDALRAKNEELQRTAIMIGGSLFKDAVKKLCSG